jgi:hypothetical protein
MDPHSNRKTWRQYRQNVYRRQDPNDLHMKVMIAAIVIAGAIWFASGAHASLFSYLWRQ